MYVIAYDIGTTGIKTCLFNIGQSIEYIDGETEDYNLYIVDGGGAEQEPEEWWNAMCHTTEGLLRRTGTHGSEIKGISFCAQMQAFVPVDEQGKPVRRAMSYMDNRGQSELEKGLETGMKVSGMNARKLLRSIRISGAVSASAKDPVWKYNWVKNNEPEVFKRVYKWLDVKDYLVCRATGRFTMSRDSAFATLLYDTRDGKKEFSSEICNMMNVDMNHLPEICESADAVGGITARASSELGLPEGVPVFSGGGDASLIGVGAGAVEPGDTHIYVGTSGWVSTVVDKQKLSIKTMIASIVGADPNSFNIFAELETAGKCLEWARERIAQDDAGGFREREYDCLMNWMKDVPAGSNGVIFTPWLHGNRCPFEDPDARGMFFNLSLDTDTRDMAHSVIEGVCMHLRWQLEAMEMQTETSDRIRFVGGGALSSLTCRILADVTGRRVETVPNPQNVGAVGAAAIMALGLGSIDKISEVKDMISATHEYVPDEDNVKKYDEIFPVFKDLYNNNKKIFKKLNARGE